MAYSGTQVAAGRGQGVVVATGMRTELGRIATLLQDVESEQTPLQRRLDRVGKQLALLGVAVALAVVVMGAIAGESATDLVLTAISVAVAVIPEGLPAVVTFTLAIGSQRMLRRQALIRKLPAVETLGSVTVICSDKTGTLTQNRMTVTVLDVAGHQVRLDSDAAALDAVGAAPSAATVTLVAGALCNDGAEDVGDDGARVWLGDPTETALLQAAVDAGLDVHGLRERIPRVGEQPFDSTRKRMSTIHAPLAGSDRRTRRTAPGRPARVRQGCGRRAPATHDRGVGQRGGRCVRRRRGTPGSPPGTTRSPRRACGCSAWRSDR